MIEQLTYAGPGRSPADLTGGRAGAGKATAVAATVRQ